MNKLAKWLIGSIVALFLIVAFIGYQYFSAEYLDEGSFLTTKTILPDSAVRIQTTGEDLRLYEFTPETMPYMQCIFVAGTNKGDTFCVLKRKYQHLQAPKPNHTK